MLKNMTILNRRSWGSHSHILWPVLALKTSNGPKLAQMCSNEISHLGGKRSNKKALAKLTRKRSDVRVISSPPFLYFLAFAIM